MFLNKNPSNAADWSPDQALLPRVQLEGTRVNILNIRNCEYRSTNDYDVQYYNKTFDINALKRLWFMLEPFSRYKGAAHMLLSFEFEKNNYVAISIEIRKKRGETFSAWRGLLNYYELMYVIGDENDLIKLRSNYRHDWVYLYPIRSSPDFTRALFVDMIQRANNLAEKPEFYNTAFNSCGSNLLHHVNKIRPGTLPWTWYSIFPENADVFLYEHGFIDSDLPLTQIRQKYGINVRAERFADATDFSRKIRK